MDTTSFLFTQEKRRVENEIALAISNIKRAKTCSEAVRYTDISVKTPFKSLGHVMGVSAFHGQADGLLQSIIDRQVRRLKDLLTIEEIDAAAAALKKDWMSLRGRHPRMFGYADHRLRLELASAKRDVTNNANPV